MTGSEFAAILRKKDAHYPLSDAYERQHLSGKHWWRSQREHVTAWLDEIEGPGAYDRKSRNLSARFAYNHFQCAPGLLWIAEALGEDRRTVRQAIEAASGFGRPATQCATIRRLIPWERIEQLTAICR